jgi:hypothetical protein
MSIQASLFHVTIVHIEVLLACFVRGVKRDKIARKTVKSYVDVNLESLRVWDVPIDSQWINSKLTDH